MGAVLRVGGSLLVALGVAGTLLLGGARLHGGLVSSGDGADGLRPVAVDAWPGGVARPDEAGRPGWRDTPPMPAPPPVTGRVHLDGRIDDAGRVVGVTVDDATVPERPPAPRGQPLTEGFSE